MPIDVTPDFTDIVQRLRRRSLSLGERLAEIAREARERDPHGSAVVDRFVQRLEEARSGADAPQVGERLPPFMMPDHEGRLISSERLLDQGPLVIVFHRGHWCPYCRMTIATLAEAQHRIGAARIVAISAEMQRFTRRIRSETGANFTFLSDMDAAYARSIGLAITVDPALSQLYERNGKRIPDFQGSAGWILPIPAVFVLNRDGMVHARHIDPDYRRRMEVEDLLRAARELGG